MEYTERMKEKYMAKVDKINKIDDVNYIHIRTSQYKGNGLKRVINILQFYFNTKRARKHPIIVIGTPVKIPSIIRSCNTSLTPAAERS